MRLLLDEMHSPRVAVGLQTSGIDVLVVNEQPLLRGRSDDELVAWATANDRAVVSENVKDFVDLAVRWASQHREHAGIILTPNTRFPRKGPSYPGSMIEALRAFVADPPVTGSSWVWWLR